MTISKLLNDTEFRVDAYLHSIILFTFLTFFFIFFVSNKTKDLFNNNISNLIHKLDPFTIVIKNNKTARKILTAINFQNLVQLGDKKDEYVEKNNSELIKLLIVVNVLLWLFIFIIIIIIKPYNNINFLQLLIGNLIIFVVVAGIEYLFIIKVAFSYSPIEPSFMSNKLIESIKNKLNN